MPPVSSRISHPYRASCLLCNVQLNLHVHAGLGGKGSLASWDQRCAAVAIGYGGQRGAGTGKGRRPCSHSRRQGSRQHPQRMCRPTLQSGSYHPAMHSHTRRTAHGSGPQELGLMRAPAQQTQSADMARRAQRSRNQTALWQLLD